MRSNSVCPDREKYARTMANDSLTGGITQDDFDDQQKHPEKYRSFNSGVLAELIPKPMDYRPNDKIEEIKNNMSEVTLQSYENVKNMDQNWVQGNRGELTKVIIPRLVKMLNNVAHRPNAIATGYCLLMTKLKLLLF